MNLEITNLEALQIARAVIQKEISAREVAQAFVDRSLAHNPKLNAYLELKNEEALLAAETVDVKIKRGEPVGVLAGVPIAIKDNICVDGWKITCASKILEGHVAAYDATVIKKLKSADALFLGRTNLDEFAMGSSTENSAYGPTKNPWNLECVPGGSSGGSAAAVAARLAPLALGSDTGGSIRQPASFCGILGLKPTYGRVSRFGLVAFASSLDQIGPFARSALDTAALLQVISGKDVQDSTSAEEFVPDFLEEVTKPIGSIKIGIPKEYFVSGLEDSVRNKVNEAIRAFEKLGAKIEEVSLPFTEYATAVYYILAPSEASANLARYDGVRYGHRSKKGNSLIQTYEYSREEGFGSEVKRRIMLGTYALSSGYYDAYYAKAQKVRTLICKDFEGAFQKVDALITPTAPTPPFKFGEKVQDPLLMYLSDIFTISCNMGGLPGISIPCGFSSNKLPIGFQILGKPYDEVTLLRMAHQYQQVTSWHKEVPPLN